MAIRGESRNLALQPVQYSDLDPHESFIPTQVELKNGRMSDAGNWTKRPGYRIKYTTTSDQAIVALIDDGPGYAVSAGGEVYALGVSPTKLGGSVPGGERINWINHGGSTLMVAGSVPMEIKKGSGVVTPIAGGPPGGKFIATVNTYTIISGNENTKWWYSFENDHGNWPDDRFKNVNDTGEPILGMMSLKTAIYFFKSRSIEIWENTGGTAVFTRSAFLEKGIGASASLVKANSVLYFLGDDLDFYRLKGALAEPISIAGVAQSSIRGELEKLTTTDDCYGLHFSAERCIRWFFPTHGKCFRFDYRKLTWSEDNAWKNGAWHRLPVASHMRHNGVDYVGDYEPTGKIYEWTTDAKTDAGNPIRVHRGFNVRLTDSGNQALLNRLLFRCKRGGVAHGSDRDPEFIVRYRFDKGPWTPYERLALGAGGDDNPYVVFQGPIGMGREWEIEISHTDDSDFTLTDVRITARDLGR